MSVETVHGSAHTNQSVARSSKWMSEVALKGTTFCCYIFVSVFGVKILNIILCMSRCGVYACVRRWAICVRPRGV